jgi:hypothetical protein
LLAAFLTAPLTAWLAMRRFSAEKWWEKKLEAYLAIIEALHHLERPYDEVMEAWWSGSETPKETPEAWLKHRESLSEIRKYIDMGELVISERASALLDRLLARLAEARRETDFAPFVEKSATAVHECLIELKRLAIEDLRLARGSWLPRPLRKIRGLFVGKE